MESPLDTNELLVRSMEGDLEAFRRLVEYYQGYAYALAMGVLLLASGCKEIQVTTRVFPNRSCERTITVEGDSSGVGEVAIWISIFLFAALVIVLIVLQKRR